MVGGLDITDDDVFGLVFPYTHIGGQTWTFTSLMTGCRLVFNEAFVPAVTIPILRAADLTLAGAGTPFHMKLAYSEARDRLCELSMRVFERGAFDVHNFYVEERLRTLSLTIAAGTSQIQRNIIGERVLGLPRERQWETP